MKHSRCYICYESNAEISYFHSSCLKKLFGSTQLPQINFNNKEIESIALGLVKQKKGLPGVQKKLSLSLTQAVEGDHKKLSIGGYLGGEYILKPPTLAYPCMPEIEDLTMHLATIAKLEVALHGLLPMANGNLAYITKRFDRNGKKKIAAEDLCQLSHKLTEDKYKSSYEKVGKVIYRYTTTPGEEILKFFELILFCFIIGNADMHLKNFSLITEDISNITLSPCYDLLSTRLLISVKHDSEELALSLNGKKQNIQKKDFIEFGKNLTIPLKVIESSIAAMSTYFLPWEQKIQKSFLNSELKEKFCNLIKMRLRVLEI
ncbi:MAG: toxin HipA [Gammaproteobacteria bacterium]|jgi:serine/threonine-protein kinase HipA|nr:toxin HipA [Gammaproteobacteria bacterium]